MCASGGLTVAIFFSSSCACLSLLHEESFPGNGQEATEILNSFSGTKSAVFTQVPQSGVSRVTCLLKEVISEILELTCHTSVLFSPV